ncbi:MAG: sensor histidine kinase [Cyclobacteriaceae bacterium]|nr:MAG: sensor histidine kinase [Cyclobacteriaceae bacterium]
MQSIIQKHRLTVLHIVFWCIYLSFNLYQISFYQQRRGYDWNNALLFAGVQFGFTFTIAYLNYFLFLPRFIRHKNIWRYLAEFSLPFALLIIGRIYTQRAMVYDMPRSEYFFSHMFTVQTVAINLFITVFVSMLRFAADWFELEANKKSMENERLTAELNFLKAQINPHFLFNTLNNLYYLAYTKSDNTTVVIEKLSQMMRYMIYDSNYDKVPLTREIEYMKNYISLEQMRLNNEIPIKFKVEGSPEEKWIAPLIFITFLENAFKHGVNNHNHQAWINVSIKLQDNRCEYVVENSKAHPSADTREKKSGIGLQNVQRRLELSYPGKYSLKTEDEPDRYRVKLDIELS